MRQMISAAAAAVVLCACTAIKGNEPVMTRSGPADTASTQGPANKFKVNEATARTSQNTTLLPNSEAEAARAMMASGFALVRANCNDFFQSAGENQKWLLFSRDTVAAVGTLAAGVLGLRGGHTNAAGNVALVTGATFTGMDIYTKNFLFSAENISAVNELIIKALDTHSEAIDPALVKNYADASNAIYDNQLYCTPMKIAALAREAIQKGVVVPTTATTEGDSITAQIDAQAYDRLGDIFQPPQALTFSQTAALWWLFNSGATPDEMESPIFELLAPMPDKNKPIDKDGVWKPGADFSLVKRLLLTFSTATQTSFKSQIAEARLARAGIEKSQPPGGVEGAPGVPRAIPPPVFVAPEPGRGSSIRVRVGIK